MNCQEARQHWNLYYDSEGDAELHFRISEHLEVCPECTEWFAQQSRLETLLVQTLQPHVPTTELWANVLSGAGLQQQRVVRRSWFAGTLAAITTVGAVMLFLAGYLVRTLTPDLAKLAVAKHERLVTREEIPQLESQSDLEVERYLRKRVSFPVRCPPRKDAGFSVQGAGICQLADQPAAYLSGHVEGTAVSIFVLPRDSLKSFPLQQRALRQEKLHRCQEGPFAMVMGVIDTNAVVVIGQTTPDRLENVLLAYGTYHDHP